LWRERGNDGEGADRFHEWQRPNTDHKLAARAAMSPEEYPERPTR
jgi:hypothetical protein